MGEQATSERSVSRSEIEYVRQFLNEHVAWHVFDSASGGWPEAQETIVRAVFDGIAAYGRVCSSLVGRSHTTEDDCGYFDRGSRS